MKEFEEVVKDDSSSIDDKDVRVLFEESRTAEVLTYKSRSGSTAKESPGKYSSHMTNLVVRDMLQTALFVKNDFAEASEVIENAMKMIRDKDLNVRRMIDDLKDNRPVIDYDYGDTVVVVKDLFEVFSDKEFKKNVFVPDEDTFKFWVERLVRLDILGYVIKTQESIDNLISDAEMRGFDDDGNQVFGISEDDLKIVHTIAKLEGLLIGALKRVSSLSDCVSPTMLRIDVLESLLREIVEDDKAA